MADTQSSLARSRGPSDRDARLRQIDSGVWALFFIWVGVVMLMGLPWAWFLLGVGTLILAAQVLRWLLGLTIETLGIAVGLIILAGGVWDLFSLPLPLIPVMLILLGGYLLWKAISPRTEAP